MQMNCSIFFTDRRGKSHLRQFSEFKYTSGECIVDKYTPHTHPLPEISLVDEMETEKNLNSELVLHICWLFCWMNEFSSSESHSSISLAFMKNSNSKNLKALHNRTIFTWNKTISSHCYCSNFQGKFQNEKKNAIWSESNRFFNRILNFESYKKTILSIFRFSDSIRLPFDWIQCKLYVLFVSEIAIFEPYQLKWCTDSEPNTLSEYHIIECEWMQVDVIISKK